MPTPRPESEHLAASFLKLFPWQRADDATGFVPTTPVVRRAVEHAGKEHGETLQTVGFRVFFLAVFGKDDTLPADGPAPEQGRWDPGWRVGVLNMKRPFWSPQDGRRDPTWRYVS